jgi:hypothetical protein
MPPRSPRSPKLMLHDTVDRPKTLKLSPIGNSLTGYAAQELKKRYGNTKTGNKKHSHNTPGGKKPHARTYRKAMLHTERGGGRERRRRRPSVRDKTHWILSLYRLFPAIIHRSETITVDVNSHSNVGYKVREEAAS